MSFQPSAVKSLDHESVKTLPYDAPVRHRRGATGAPVLLIALLGLSALSCSKKDSGKPASISDKARPVQTVRVAQRPMERTINVTGSLAAQERAELRVKVSGRVQNVAIDLGSVVKKGDILVQIEPRDYELRVQQSRAALAHSRVALGLPVDGTNDSIALENTTPVQEAKAVFDEARKNRERLRDLSREGISSKSELDTVESQFSVAAARFEAAAQESRKLQAVLAQRRAEVEIAQQELADTAIRAPFDGAVQARIASPGEYLAVSAPVANVVRTDPLRLRLEVPERESLNVRPGQMVRIRVEGDTGAYEGRIARLSPAISDLNRMLMVEADVPNNGVLRPGLFVRAEIVTNERDPGLAVPTNAVITFAGLEKLIVVRDGKAVEARIQTKRRGSNWVEVIGVQPNDVVVLDPGNLRTGQSVVVKEAGPATAKTAGAQDG